LQHGRDKWRGRERIFTNGKMADGKPESSLHMTITRLYINLFMEKATKRSGQRKVSWN